MFLAGAGDEIIGDDLVANINAPITNVGRRSEDERLNLALAPATEAAS
jgi:hypothetical protein